MQRIDDLPFEVVRIPWLNVRINTRKLAEGQLEVRDVEVSQPTLRLRRRRDGTWNLDGLLADPWPGPWIKTPPITIQNATLELIPDPEPAEPAAPPSRSPWKKNRRHVYARFRLRASATTGSRRQFLRRYVRSSYLVVPSAGAPRFCAMSTSRSRRPKRVPNASSLREPPAETHSSE